jgi:tRNA (Thr-GGU) A37 N-methylase
LLLDRFPAGVAALHPIGHVRSIFRDRRGTPRQGCLAPGAIARLELAAACQARESLAGLEAFSHLWLLFVFHQNTNTSALLAASRSAVPSQCDDPSVTLPAWCAPTPPDVFPHARWKVAPPRLGGERVGVFATRTPHRPNPIGLSLVSIVSIDATANPPYILLR